MVDAFVLSLTWGPVGVTLGCWLFSVIVAARSHKEAVVRVLADRQSSCSCRARQCTPYTPELATGGADPLRTKLPAAARRLELSCNEIFGELPAGSPKTMPPASGPSVIIIDDNPGMPPRPSHRKGLAAVSETG